MASDSIHDHFTAKQIQVLQAIADFVLKLQEPVPAQTPEPPIESKRPAAKKLSVAEKQAARLGGKKQASR